MSYTARSTGRVYRRPKHHDGPVNGHRRIWVIAEEIWRDWKPDPVTRKGGVNYAALPYLRAMGSLHDVYSVYGPGEESAVTIVVRFLDNARSWRGDTARRVKAELRAIVGTTKKERP